MAPQILGPHILKSIFLVLDSANAKRCESNHILFKMQQNAIRRLYGNSVVFSDFADPLQDLSCGP